MTASRADIQAKLDAAVAEFKLTTTSGAKMVTRYGQDTSKWGGGHWRNAMDDIAAARAEVADLLDPAPAPTPQPTSQGWAWDATNATVRSDSAAKINALVTTNRFAYLMAEIAYAEVHDDTATYAVSTAGKVGAMDATIYVPTGTKTGLNTDHHLCIADHVRGRWHDFWHATFDSSGKLVDWKGGSSMPLGAVNITYVSGKTNQGADAAMFPLFQGSITPAEIKAGVIPHALCYSSATPGPAPNPYPSSAKTGYPDDSAHHGHIPLGGWIRMAPDATLASTATPLERAVFDCLKRYGAFCRDQNSATSPGNFSLHGLDLGGGGSSLAAWKDAGVTLDPTRGMDIKFGSTSIPWSKLQYLEPPPAV